MPRRRGATYRRCPSCQVVRPASEFPRAIGTTFAVSGLQRRRCPECGHVGRLMSFQVAARPAELDEGTPS
jgi:hypothetical protein